MSGFTETIDTITTTFGETSIIDTPTNSGNTIITTTNTIPYHPGFPEEDRGVIAQVCDYCRELRCTNPECEKQLQADYEYDRTCIHCNAFFYTLCEVSYHELHCTWKHPPPFNTEEELVAHDESNCWNKTQPFCNAQTVYCGSCDKVFQTEEELIEHNPEKCWNDTQPFYRACCSHPFNTQVELTKHDEHRCWNEDALSRMEDDRAMWEEWDAEERMLEEEERLAEWREECRQEARMDKAASIADRRLSR